MFHKYSMSCEIHDDWMKGEIPDFHRESSPKPIKGSHRTSPQDSHPEVCQGRSTPITFHIIGDKLINPIVGVFMYQLYKRIPYFSGGMTIPNIGSLVFRHTPGIFGVKIPKTTWALPPPVSHCFFGGKLHLPGALFSVPGLGFDGKNSPIFRFKIFFGGVGIPAQDTTAITAVGDLVEASDPHLFFGCKKKEIGGKNIWKTPCQTTWCDLNSKSTIPWKMTIITFWMTQDSDSLWINIGQGASRSPISETGRKRR